jgi:hypothetical protein
MSSLLMFAIGGGIGLMSKGIIEALKDAGGYNNKWECRICLDLLAEKNRVQKEMSCVMRHRFYGSCLNFGEVALGVRHLPYMSPPAPAGTRDDSGRAGHPESLVHGHAEIPAKEEYV